MKGIYKVELIFAHARMHLGKSHQIPVFTFLLFILNSIIVQPCLMDDFSHLGPIKANLIEFIQDQYLKTSYPLSSKQYQNFQVILPIQMRTEGKDEHPKN